MLQVLAAATAVVLWRAVDGLRRRGARRLGPLPPLIVVRPIRGLAPGLAANVRAALAQRYPGALETIFVLDDTGDPAYPVVRLLVNASSARARVVIAGPIHPGAHRQAPRDDRGAAVLRRRALKAAGGLGASAGQLVDDMDIGARLAHARFSNVLIGAPIAIRSDGMSWAAFRALALRWMIYSRTGIPLWPFGMPAMVLMAFHVTVIAAIRSGVNEGQQGAKPCGPLESRPERSKRGRSLRGGPRDAECNSLSPAWLRGLPRRRGVPSATRHRLRIEGHPGRSEGAR